MPILLLEESKLGCESSHEADFSETELEGLELLVQTGRFRVLYLQPVNQHILLCFKELRFAARAVLQHF